MLHHYLYDDTRSDHWAVGHNGTGLVLLQVQERGDQARIPLTPEQAEKVVQELLRYIAIARTEDVRIKRDLNR